MTPLAAHPLAAVPDDCVGTLTRVDWRDGCIEVSIDDGSYYHVDVIRPEPGLSIQDAEIHAVQLACMGFLSGSVQHRLDLDCADDVSDDDLTDALAAATARGDLDVADLLDLATARGIGPTEPAPAVRHMGYRH